MSIEDRDYYEHHKAKDYPMDVWTEEDERKLQTMQKKKEQTFEKARENLLDLMKSILPKHGGSTYSGHYAPRDVADALIKHGGMFRDALEPFDHMGRPTPSVPVWWSDRRPGPMPVREDATVQVTFRDGTEETGKASEYVWEEVGDTTIVAYRVIG